MASTPPITITAFVLVYDAAPAPEDDPTPALVAAKRHLVDLRGDPEFDFAVEHCTVLILGRMRTEWREPRERDFLGKCVARDSTVDLHRYQEQKHIY